LVCYIVRYRSTLIVKALIGRVVATIGWRRE
jgi:hypothetical protein